MIGKKTLKNYGFKSIEDYYNYIIDSQINGNHKQVKELFKKLNDEQKKVFFNYLEQFDNGYFNIAGVY